MLPVFNCRSRQEKAALRTKWITVTVVCTRPGIVESDGKRRELAFLRMIG